MIVEDFPVRSIERFDELQQFLVVFIPAAFFRKTPHHYFNTDTNGISLQYNLYCTIKLDELDTKCGLKDEKNTNKSNKSIHHFFPKFSFSSS